MTRTAAARLSACARRGGAVLLSLGTLAAAPASGTPLSQDDGTSREQAALAEEQALIRRQLRRLRDTMGALADRLEAEGRVHAAGLLRDALSELDERPEDTGGRTLEELIDGSKDDLSGGRTMSALERQQAVEARLGRLLEILLDRRGLDTLEEELAALEEIKAGLEQVADGERRLRERTAQLEEQSRTDQHRALDEELSALLDEQRDLLRRAEDLARASGTFDLEQLRDRLREAVEEQRMAAGALETWSPQDTERIEASRPALSEARAGTERARRAEAAQEALEAAAQAAAGDEEERRAAADALAAVEPDAAAAKDEDVDALPPFARLRSSQACLSGNLCVMQTSVPQPRHRYAFTAVSFSLHLGAPQRFDLLGCLFGSHEVDECRSKVTWMLSPGTCLTLLPHSGHTTHVVSCAYRWHRRQRQIWFSGDIRCKYAPARRSRIRGRSCGPGRRSERILCTRRAESPAGRIRGRRNSRRA